MGVVYEAIDRETGERVALKTLQHLTAQSLYRFKNEFRALRGIYHRNLVRLGELHGQDEQWFFTMELVEGTNVLLHVRPRPVVPATGSRPDVAKAAEPLEERAGHGPPAGFPRTDEADEGDDRTPPDGTPIDDATVVSPNRPSTGEARAAASSPGVEPDWERLGKDLQQIVDALVALHDAGKVHRDLKPSNVLVTEQGRVVLLDFGLVMDRRSDEAVKLSATGALTVGYMAPEQATLGGTGPAADYYALGVILYQMITGRMPFQGPPAEILAQKRLGPPPDPRVLCPNAPEELARLALDLLSPTPEARPSGEEVKRRLSRHQRRSSRPPSGYASISLVDISYLGYGPSRSPIDDPAGLAAAWRLPFDGMNEKGLAVGQMAVPSADGGPGKERPLIGSLGIIRVLLDRAADVGEALALMEGYDVLFDEVPLHYLVADASGAAAVVEYLDGRPRVLRSGKDWAVATNFVISSTPPEARDRACGRYALAGASLGPSGGLLRGEDEAFGLLGRLAQANTRWSAIYELGPRRLRLALGRDYRRIYGWRL